MAYGREIFLSIGPILLTLLSNAKCPMDIGGAEPFEKSCAL